LKASFDPTNGAVQMRRARFGQAEAVYCAAKYQSEKCMTGSAQIIGDVSII
jgi:hypothetical protein